MPEVMTIILIFIFFIIILLSYAVGVKLGSMRRDKFWETQIPTYRKEAIIKSRAVIGGQFSEQLAPYLPNFPFKPTECKFLGKPIDFVIFKGMDDKKINEIVFLEIKSAKSKISQQEKNLKETIEKGKVSWREYRVPEDLTKGEIGDENVL
ncbi:MAG: Holliday junction resolvase-like protein [Candidatus Pacearchaeota archaeon]